MNIEQIEVETRRYAKEFAKFSIQTALHDAVKRRRQEEFSHDIKQNSLRGFKRELIRSGQVRHVNFEGDLPSTPRRVHAEEHDVYNLHHAEDHDHAHHKYYI